MSAEETDRKEIVEGLSKLLAETYALYLRTQNFHWNVTGPRFRELHLMFEEQYGELALAVDGVAERIRAIGSPAPATFREFSRLSTLEEEEGVPNAESMLRKLAEGHGVVLETARVVRDLADEAGDIGTENLLAERCTQHEKTIWMIHASV